MYKTFSISENVENKSIEVKLKLLASPNVDEELHRDFHSAESEILDKAIICGQMILERISAGCVVLQLRPLTENATQLLLKAKENNRLFEMIFEMLKQINIFDKMVGSNKLEIKVQVCYASATKPNSGKFQCNISTRQGCFCTFFD